MFRPSVRPVAYSLIKESQASDGAYKIRYCFISNYIGRRCDQRSIVYQSMIDTDCTLVL